MKKNSQSKKMTNLNHHLSIYVDGSSYGNPGPASVGVAIFNERGDKIKEVKEKIGITTNNVAEYCAAIVAMVIVMSYANNENLPLSQISISIHSDSELLVRQCEGRYKIKSENIIPLNFILNNLISKFKNVNFKHINRKENKVAHSLATN